MYRIAICDDDPLTVEYIAELITEKFEDNHKLFKFKNPMALELYIENVLKGELDILIVDIDLGADNGIKVADRIKKQYEHIKVIFISGMANYAGDIFEIKPVYFLIKPIDPNKLMAGIKLAIDDMEASKRDTISITAKEGIFSLDLRKIEFIESNKRTVTIYEQGNKRELYIKLDELSKMLTERFCRCHQSFIVNLDYVSQLSMYQVTLHCGVHIPVSQSRYKAFKQSFIRYLGDTL
jgi:DNA-binding LytR/AlgR family response regulator